MAKKIGTSKKKVFAPPQKKHLPPSAVMNFRRVVVTTIKKLTFSVQKKKVLPPSIPVIHRRPMSTKKIPKWHAPPRRKILAPSVEPTPVTIAQQQIGKFRIQNLSIQGYVMYVGVGTLPDLNAAPSAFGTTLPLQLDYALPISGTTILYVVPRLRDSYGLESQNQNPTILTLTASGAVGNDIPVPLNIMVLPRQAGAIRILASYPTFVSDEDPADMIRVWVGLTLPDPNIDTPAYIGTVNSPDIVVEFGAYAPGTYFVVVGLFRSFDSKLSPTVTATVVIPEVPEEPEGVFTQYEIL